MQFTIAQNVFINALKKCFSVITRNPVHQMLSCFYIEAKDDQTITIMSTDLDISIIDQISATVLKPGKIAINGYSFYTTIKACDSLSDINVCLSDDQNRLLVDCKNSHFDFSTLSAEMFPVIQKSQFQHGYVVSDSKLHAMIIETIICTSHEETRYHLNGVYFHIHNKNMLRLVATDGHRLAKAQTTISEVNDHVPSVIVPKKALSILEEILNNNFNFDIKINVSESLIQFEYNNLTMISRIIDGQFPDYERVIPQDNDKIVILSVKSLQESIPRITGINFDKKTKGIKIFFQPNKLKLLFEDPLIGSATDEIDVQYSDENFQLAINATYLVETLKNWGKRDRGDKDSKKKDKKDDIDIKLLVKDSNAPIMIQELNSDHLLYIIMPMRV